MNVSPFQRTVSTSAEICKQLNINEAKIDYTYCETLAEWIYPDGDPMPHLEIRKMDSEAFNRKYGLDNSVKFIDSEAEYQEVCTGMYPESPEAKLRRVKANYERTKREVGR